MALKIEWSNEAEQTYLDILSYLENKWSRKEVLAFIKRTEILIDAIAAQPYSFEAARSKNIRKAVIGKQNSLIYQITDTHIYLLTFWDNRQNPAKSKY